MDITGIDVAAFVGAIGSLIKAIHSDSKTSKIQSEGKQSREYYNTQIAVLENEQKNIKKELDEGNARFGRLEAKMDQINDTLIRFSAKFEQYVEIKVNGSKYSQGG